MLPPPACPWHVTKIHQGSSPVGPQVPAKGGQGAIRILSYSWIQRSPHSSVSPLNFENPICRSHSRPQHPAWGHMWGSESRAPE